MVNFGRRRSGGAAEDERRRSEHTTEKGKENTPKETAQETPNYSLATCVTGAV